MPRTLVIGNGHMFIGFDGATNMRDLYYPYVGQLNHIGGNRNSIGVYVDGHFSWCDESGWEIRSRYRPGTLITDVCARHAEMGVTLHMEDAVHFREHVYVKKIRVVNEQPHVREIRIFFTHDFCIDETEIGDTACYDPVLNAVYHYKRSRYLLANGYTHLGGLFQYTTGIKRFHSLQGTWKDAEDGELSGNPIAQGSVDSTVSFKLHVPGDGEETMYYWISVGRTFPEVKESNAWVLQRTPERLFHEIDAYWREWLRQSHAEFGDLPEPIIELYKLSLMTVQTLSDANGAIIAANDTDILQYNRDHYSYMWPRDGALIAHAMSQAGFERIANRFFRFCEDALTAGGFLLHKYNPDGSVGSSWHPYLKDGEPQLPIQEDETGLVLWALWEHYQKYGDVELAESLYPTLIAPAGDFLIEYVYPQLNLPIESYDLWEERRGIFTFTVSTVIAGVRAARNFAQVFGDVERAQRMQSAAERLLEGLDRHLYDPVLGRFLRGVELGAGGEIKKDKTLESSLYGLFHFDILSPDDPRLQATMERVWEGLRVRTDVGGVARYTDDGYFRKSGDIESVPGNPWIICTLWEAAWRIEAAETLEDLAVAKEIFEWVLRHRLESGLLPEQLHPYKGTPLSVAPLTWSHATLVQEVLRYGRRYRELANKSMFAGKETE
ncbi:glycoside hydrolase family 15 protein [Tumebacillus sp. DT12]|uniref:Glycoside hydrolase family 15 protein n=1 Tax=Tumebacillus lacus TaxID=2995335 RepID=A0ABT3X1D6_9BACL|nr:glycoside hydrolase family 15 protein [Tumebacillus lacus]MCX7570704.1 glycoside hydrolase family 15 protein [Tumebacillus lacus]